MVPGDPRIAAYLDRRVQILPQVAVVRIMDTSGVLTHSSDAADHAGTDLSDQEYFTATRSMADGRLVLGVPATLIPSKLRYFPVSRRLTDAAGKFSGVAVALIEQAYFDDFYRSIGLGGRISIDRGDGTVLASDTAPGIGAEQPADLQVEQRLDPPGVVIAASLSRARILQHWFGHIAQTLVAGLLAVLATGLMGLLLYAQMRRLEVSERRFRDFANAASDWFWETDPEHRFTSLSGALPVRYGVTVGSALGARRDRALEKLSIDPKNLARHLDDLAHRRPFRDFIYRAIDLEGRAGHIKVSGTPVFDRQGNFAGYRGTASDISKQVMAQQALAEAEADYRGVFENLPIGFYRSLPDGRQLRANPALVRLNGYESEAAQIAAVHDIAKEWYVNPERRNDFISALVQNGRVADFESEIYRHKTRERIWVTESATMVRDSEGRPLYYEGTVQDITQRKQAEEALRRSQTRLTEAQTLAHIGNWQHDHRADRLEWSDEIFRIFEVEPPAFSGTFESFLAFVHPEDRGNLTPLAGRTAFTDSYRLLMPDGRIKHVQSRATTTVDVDGHPLVSIGTLQDITSLKLAELELARSSKQLQLTFESMDQGVFLVDADFRVAAWNSRVVGLLDLEPGQIHVGQPYEAFVRGMIARGEYGDGDPQAHLDRLLKFPRLGRGIVHERVRPNGVVLEIRLQPLGGGGLILTYTDITDRRQVEVALMNAKEQAEAANRAKSTFLANMSHELRTPLNAILGFAEIIRDRIFGRDAIDRYSDYARDIHNSGRHLLDVIGDILDMSKIEAGRFELDEETFSASSVIRDCIAMVAGRAAAGGIELVEQYGGALPEVVADRRAFKQVVLNLLSNAVKFTESGGRVAIYGERDVAGALLIRIADTGIGIPVDALERIFEPFQQADLSLGRRYEGTGLGLSISRSLMHLHGGSLELVSELGGGTVATIRMPTTRVLVA